MIKFGPSGNSESFYAAGYAHTEEAASFVKRLGLDCFEYSFGRGVRMTEGKARSIGEAFAAADVEISVHAPYFINFANPDDEMAEKSYGYLLDSAKAAYLMGGRRVVFHPAAQGKASREEAVLKTEDRLKYFRDIVYERGMEGMIYCPETMGKMAQIGTLEEVARFCKIDPIYTPCIDFGHINAREQGSLKSEEDYLS
ncbi:MAG: TIM barrel protein, partial [Clostridia bacterium]|nr:TIM barrel protein [Clostridia bacterium]